MSLCKRRSHLWFAVKQLKTCCSLEKCILFVAFLARVLDQAYGILCEEGMSCSYFDQT